MTEKLTPVETPEPKAEKHSLTEIRAIQGLDETKPVSDTTPPKMDIKASEFSTQTHQDLRNQGLNRSESVLADDSGTKAEQVTQTVLKNEGLPDGSGGTIKFKELVTGQHDNNNHGIDLIGVTEDGRPYPIEVKKRQDQSKDSMGNDRAQNLLPQTEKLRQDVLRERVVNPAMHSRYENLPHGEPDPELSNRQMGGMWTRDCWLRLTEDPIHRQLLLEAGLNEKYLNPDNLDHAYSKEWKEILDNRTTMIVSGEKDRATAKLMRQAALQRGTDVFILDLEQ